MQPSRLKGRDLLSLGSLDRRDVETILHRSRELKVSYLERRLDPILSGVIVGLLFEKPSTRTRVSFEAAVNQLGGEAIYLRPDELQLRRGEPIKDTARVLSGYVDALIVRTYAQRTLEEFAQYASIPIINALSDIEHPTQIICDMLTVEEVKGKLDGLTFAWIGDGNNVCNSWMLGGAMFGMDMAVACPKGYEPSKEIYERALKICEASGGRIRILRSPREAARDADILYTDVWISMGQEGEAKIRERAFEGFQVNQQLLRYAKEDAIVMHCLPAHRGMEITEEVLEGPRSVVWKQAENKLHGARGILASILT